MYTESKIAYSEGLFFWLHEIVGDTIVLKGDPIEREKLVCLIKVVSDCSHVCIYRKENGVVDIALTFSNWVMLDSIKNVCCLFGEDYRHCYVAFYPNGDCVNARLSLFTRDDVPF
jgi:hypothetical protein